MTHISLFSGIGGIDLAAEWAGFETIECVEINPYCQKVLAKNFPGATIHSDITTYNPSIKPTLVSAGFPCQPHSLAGKRKASLDERDLWGEVVRVLGEAQPRWFLGENVPGLLTSERGRFFGRVVDDLAQMGYSVGWGMWRAADVGAVHKRNRVFIVAYSKHNGLYESKVGRSVSQSENERRLQQPERCFTPDSHIGLLTANDKIQAGRNTTGDGSPAPDTNSIAGLQTNPSACAIGAERHSWGDVMRSLGRGDWKTWSVEPVIRPDDDGLPRWVARHRVEAMKALGNAVVPQQVYPLLKAIADYEMGI